MAKIRIYELARDLNLTNKVLLEKIRDLDIPIKNHMSSVDEDAIAKIKASLFGTKAEEIEETRVRPTIIRRRKKIVPKEPDEQTAAEVEPEDAIEPRPVPDEASEGEVVAADMGTPVQAEDQPEEVPAIPETETVEIEAIPQAEAKVTKIDPEDMPAKIVAPKKEPAAVPPESQVLDSETVPPEAEVESTTEETESETIETEVSQPPETVAVEPPPQPETETTTPPEDPSEKVETLETVETAPTPVKPAKPGKKKRKIIRESPAKIIKMPANPVPPTPAPAARKKPAGKVSEFPRRAKAAPRNGAPPQAPPPPDDQGKKKRAKKTRAGDTGQEGRFSKKKISFKRKEVIEHSQLYAGGKMGRKGKRGAKSRAAATGQKTQITTAKAIKRRIKVDDTIVLAELAKRMGIKANELIGKLMGMGVMATVNQTIDFDTAVLVAAEFEYEIEKAAFEEETFLKQEVDDPDKMAGRPPVVTVMGHVDHGKTSLLDVIRETRVTEREAGGITQHIGAYNVATASGQMVFLDTPGHEAFTAMRSRGAKVTDLVVLVVAADDGVMPQTVEAINHARAAEVPIIVAINKIDKQNADPDRVQRQLAELGLTPEDWGGDTIYVKVSAKQKTNIDELLELILLQSEVLELKANAEKLAQGHVVEAKLDAGRGPVATVLVLEGTLRVGDPVVCGVHHGKIRSLVNDRGQQVESAGPSMPVEIQGLSGVPMAGDEFVALADEKDAKQVSQYRTQKQRSLELAKTSRVSLEKLFETMKEGEIKDLNIVLKADVHGSIEALQDALVKLSNEEVKIKVIHSATGTISESDVSLATVSDAIIIGFNVRPTPKIQAFANDENVDMRFYNVIYNVIKDVKEAIAGMMSSTFEERLLGRAEVRQTFTIPKVGTIAGCYVTDGKIERGRQVRLLRDGVVIYEGNMASLRRFKDDAKEVNSGYECGIGIEKFNDIKDADIIECFYMEEIRPEIE
jgi:translation initiation factor IF-2